MRLPSAILLSLFLASTGYALDVRSGVRGDGLLSPGAGAIAVATRGEVLADAIESANPVNGKYPEELLGVRVWVDGEPCGLWIARPESVWFVVPMSVRLLGRGLHTVTVVAASGAQYSAQARIADASPGMASTVFGGPAGIWQVGWNPPSTLYEQPVMIWPGESTRVGVICDGLWRYVGGEHLVGGVYVWLNDRRVRAVVYPLHVGTFQHLVFELPHDLPSGAYWLRVGTARSVSESPELPVVIWRIGEREQ